MEELLDATNFFGSMPNDKLDLIMYYQPVVDGDLYPEHPIWRFFYCRNPKKYICHEV
jgi:hypothetical protein